MLSRLTFIILIVLPYASFSQAKAGRNPKIRVSTDLRVMDKDRLLVSFDLPEKKLKTYRFCLPRMVPGIYGELNFGLNIDSIWVEDRKGNKQSMARIDTNTWLIPQNRRWKKIRYLVNDDYEDFSTYKGLAYKSPRSTFRLNEFYIVNHNSVFGYIPGYEKHPYEVVFRKPAHLTDATSLPVLFRDDSTLVYAARDYHFLVDNPVMFAPADTSIIRLDGVNVTVACYSSSGQKISGEIAGYIEPLLHGQKEYLGGKLPVDNYHFIIYHHASNDSMNYFFDGLEHSGSTVILLNMLLDRRMISHSVYGIASHEFFHTVIPLSLHSEEIEYYNFQRPAMSKHLWLYEGMTEYFTMHMPVRQGMQPIQTFAEAIEGKIKIMKGFDNKLSLTELSKNAISRQDQYMNVYARGPLVSLCLDIRLRELSGGNYGVQELIRDLLKKYGYGKPFKDEQLFAEIISVSGKPELADFFARYIEGKEDPPLKEYLAKIGMSVDDAGLARWMENPSGQQLTLRKAVLGH